MKFSKLVTSQPRKKRKQLYGLKIHARKRLLRIHLSKQLRLLHKKRALLAKKGDKVKVLRGEFRKREGKIVDVDVKNSKIFIEGIIRKKQGGKEVPAPLEPSNCILLEWAEPKKKFRRAKGKVGKAQEVKKTAEQPRAAPHPQAQNPIKPAGIAVEKSAHPIAPVQHPSHSHDSTHGSANMVK